MADWSVHNKCGNADRKCEFMNIVFLEADSLGSDVNLEEFNELGNVMIYRRSELLKNRERIREADIIVANKIILSADLLSGAKKLKAIALTSTGTNVVDFGYTRSHGITVMNVKDYSTQSVAQHTFALFFYLYEKLNYYDNFVKSGDYAKSDIFSHFDKKFNEMYGGTWGIIGLGNIGHRVASIAEAFGMNVIYYSTSGNHDDPIYERVDFDTLLSKSDVISIHAPLNEKTRNLVDGNAMARMKKNCILLNLGRGSIVNEADLLQALTQGQIAGAGLDVLEKEPMSFDNPLLTFKDSTKLIITPHIAWATVEARTRCAHEVYLNLKAYLAGESRNAV